MGRARKTDYFAHITLRMKTRKLFRRKKLVVLGYHSVSDSTNRSELGGTLYEHLSLPLARFEEHLRYFLDAGYTFLQVSDMLKIQRGEKALPPRSVLLYFDDGFRDIFLNAYPLLKKLGVKVTLFVTTDFISQKSVPRWAEGRDVRNARMFLTWEEVRTMRDVFEIGSHGMTHQRFTSLDSESIMRELAESHDVIERETGTRPLAFSFPHSAWNEASKKAATEAGYCIVVGVGRGYNYGPDYFFLKKIPTSSTDTVTTLRMKLAFFPLMEIIRRGARVIKKMSGLS